MFIFLNQNPIICSSFKTKTCLIQSMVWTQISSFVFRYIIHVSLNIFDLDPSCNCTLWSYFVSLFTEQIDALCVYVCKQNGCSICLVVPFPYLILWTYLYDFQTNVKDPEPFFCCPCVGDEVLYHRDKRAGWGTPTGKKKVHESCLWSTDHFLWTLYD